MLTKPSLIGLSKDEVEKILVKCGLQKFRAKQVWHWLYYRGVTDFSLMSNIAKDVRKQLADRFDLSRPEISSELVSSDGSIKWLLKFEDGNEVETVYMPEEDRGTLCISSQIGCTNACKFCNTGQQVLVRNMTAREIISQVLITRDYLGEWEGQKTEDRGQNSESTLTPPLSLEGRGSCTSPSARRLSNIVIMGMGEPLFNYPSVARAVKIITDPEGIAISRRRVTLSTAGVVPMIERCGKELGINLAVSLHGVNDEVRDEIMPINKKYPIKELLSACKNYAEITRRKVTFEYVMLKGINDSPADAKELIRLLKDIPAKINLIPFNSWEGCEYECSSNNTIREFTKLLNANGYAAPIRKSKGEDIMAACGQLRSKSERENKTEDIG